MQRKSFVGGRACVLALATVFVSVAVGSAGDAGPIGTRALPVAAAQAGDGTGDAPASEPAGETVAASEEPSTPTAPEPEPEAPSEPPPAPEPAPAPAPEPEPAPEPAAPPVSDEPSAPAGAGESAGPAQAGGESTAGSSGDSGGAGGGESEAPSPGPGADDGSGGAGGAAEDSGSGSGADAAGPGSADDVTGASVGGDGEDTASRPDAKGSSSAPETAGRGSSPGGGSASSGGAEQAAPRTTVPALAAAMPIAMAAPSGGDGVAVPIVSVAPGSAGTPLGAIPLVGGTSVVTATGVARLPVVGGSPALGGFPPGPASPFLRTGAPLPRQAARPVPVTAQARAALRLDVGASPRRVREALRVLGDCIAALPDASASLLRSRAGASGPGAASLATLGNRIGASRGDVRRRIASLVGYLRRLAVGGLCGDGFVVMAVPGRAFPAVAAVAVVPADGSSPANVPVAAPAGTGPAIEAPAASPSAATAAMVDVSAAGAGHDGAAPPEEADRSRGIIGSLLGPLGDVAPDGVAPAIVMLLFAAIAVGLALLARPFVVVLMAERPPHRARAAGRLSHALVDGVAPGLRLLLALLAVAALGAAFGAML